MSPEITENEFEKMDLQHGGQFPEIRHRISKYQGSEKARSFLIETRDDIKKTTEDLEDIELDAKVIDELEDNDGVKNLHKRSALLAIAQEFIDEIDSLKVAGQPLRITQKQALANVITWLEKYALTERELMGYIVHPTGSGKTNEAILISQMAPDKAVFIAYNNKKRIHDDFLAHQRTFPKNQRRTVGACYGDKNETEADFIITNFASQHKWEGINWDNVGYVFVDEADVNGLSRGRVSFLRKLAAEKSIPIIAITATEEQSSGKKLRDAYPFEIDRIGMPDGLPRALKMEIVAPMRFHDLYIDAKMKVNEAEMIRKNDLSDGMVTDFIRENAWVEGILDDYMRRSEEEGDFKKGIIVFRDNSLLKNTVEHARKRGIKVEAYYGKLDDKKRLEYEKKFAQGEIHLLIGSSLMQRGVHLEGISIVYNSVISRSHQLFWQPNGRGASPNRNDPHKVVDIVAVLPNAFVDRFGRELPLHLRPFCHAAFFDPDYYQASIEQGSSDVNSKKTPSKETPTVFDLRQLEFVRSIEEIAEITGRLREKHTPFKSRATFLTDLIRVLDVKITHSLIWKLVKMDSKKMIALYETIIGSHSPLPSQDTLLDVEQDEVGLEKIFEERMGYVTEENELPQYFTNSNDAEEHLFKIAARANPLRYAQEAALIEAAKEGDKNAMHKLFQAYFPLVLALATKMQVEAVSLSDLVNETFKNLLIIFEKKKKDLEGRITGWVLFTAFRSMERYILNHSKEVRIPINRYENMTQRENVHAKRVVELRHNEYDRQSLSENEYLRAIGLDYRDIELLDEFGGRSKVKQFLEASDSLMSFLIHQHQKYPTSLKNDEKKELMPQMQSHTSLKEEGVELALKIAKDQKIKDKLIAILDYLEEIKEKIKNNALIEERLLHVYPDQLERDFEQWAEVDPDATLYQALVASGKNDIFEEENFPGVLPEAEIAINEADRHDKIRAVLATLKLREEEIIRLRYALPSRFPDKEKFDLSEIGQLYNLTRERIRQIEGKALRRLRHPRRSRKLREFNEG